MSGGNLLAYSAITTKIRAMRSNLLSEEQFSEIAHLSTVADVFVYLQKSPAYSELFADIDPATIHRGQIEWLLNFSTYEDYSKIYHYARNKQKEYLDLYFMRYEISTLKRYMRAVFDPRQSTPPAIVENDFEKHSCVNTVKVAESANMVDFVENLKGTIYYEVFSKINTLGEPSLFDYEMGLDLFYFTTFWKKKDSLFKGSDREFLMHSYGSRIDLLNMLWIYRCKTYYSVSNAEIYTFLIPVSYKIKNSDIKALVEADTKDEILDLCLKTHYGRRYKLNRNEPLEAQFNNIIYSIILKDFKDAPYSLAAINAYFHLKNTETAKIITALECIRYGYTPERVLQYINGKGSDV